MKLHSKIFLLDTEIIFYCNCRLTDILGLLYSVVGLLECFSSISDDLFCLVCHLWEQYFLVSFMF